MVEPGGAVRIGRIADCVLDDPSPDAWHAAVAALTAELRRRGADLAESFGAAPWMAEGSAAAATGSGSRSPSSSATAAACCRGACRST